MDYLNANIQTINIHSPTLYYGWLGNNSGSLASGIKWFTQTFNSFNLNNPELATNNGFNYFSDIKDACEISDHIYILDGTRFRAFSAGAIPVERVFYNEQAVSNMLFNPLSFDVDETGYYVYISDPPANKIYKLNIDLSENPAINIELLMGGFGSAIDHNKFNSPTQILYSNGNVYILDYNNICIKQFNSDLNWIYTYNSDIFSVSKPISIAVNPSTQMLYVLTSDYKVLIFDNLSNVLFETIDLSYIIDKTNLLEKILFDDNGDFFYILTELTIIKFTASGLYITDLNLPKTSNFTYRNIKRGPNKSFLVSMPYGLEKFQDVLEIFKLGNGLPSKTWSLDQLKVKPNEFTLDLNYNRSLIRMTQNVKTFRDTLNAKFIIASEQTKYGLITYFSWLPIDVTKDLPKLNTDVENEALGVGINELHVPSVFNRELEKIYNSIELLKKFLEIETVAVNVGNNNNCADQFCWSWNAMASFELTLPFIRTCNINPITYSELQSNFPAKYAPTKTWGEAISKCCAP